MNIQPYDDRFRPQLLQLWERSVLATHHFLSAADFKEIKALVASINFHDLQVFCLTDQHNLAGFVGVAEKKIEMLFLDPAYFGKGWGKQLLRFAVEELGADRLDVNEQNLEAVQFYLHAGFRVTERTEKDEQGRDYPLLRMKLAVDGDIAS